MSRTLVRWLIFGLCVIVLLTALGWGTVHLLRLEKEREEMARQADEQELVRLALWRMDSKAGGILVAENARPVQHFQAFPDLGRVYTKSFQVLGKGETFVASPLLTHEPGPVRLFFMKKKSAPFQCTSPQVPTGNQRDLAETYYSTDGAAIEASQKLLDQASGLIRRWESGGSELDDQKRESRLSSGERFAEEVVDDADSESVGNRFFRDQLAAVDDEDLAAQVLKEIESTDSKDNRQYELNSNEAVERSRIIRSQAYDNVGRSSSSPKLKSESPAVSKWAVADSQAQDSLVADEAKMSAVKNKASQPGSATESVDGRTPAEAAPSRASEPIATLPSTPPASSAPIPAAPQMKADKASSALRYSYGNSLVPSEESSEESAPEAEVQPFLPFFVEEELFLMRDAILDGEAVEQYCWLDRQAIEADLLAAVADTFPTASLVPTGASADGSNPRVLAALPLRLVGSPLFQSANTSTGWSPLKRSLLLSWIGVLGAAAAVAALLRGALALSERRGAFVSAVTHELRTPLTTFQLYADLLADDMVKEPAKRKEYLEVMRGEAGRLGHLVENVLAYAQLEKGGERRRAETLSLTALVERVAERLHQRAGQDEMELIVTIPEAAAERLVTVDVSAVEQILFNLVDNACKYARLHFEGTEFDPRIHLEADAQAKVPLLRVRDHGQGIAEGEARRLFRPFRKSAREASHTAPGVGLGLALCQRLSKRIGGSLRLERNSRSGASFVLELPQA